MRFLESTWKVACREGFGSCASLPKADCSRVPAGIPPATTTRHCERARGLSIVRQSYVIVHLVLLL